MIYTLVVVLLVLFLLIQTGLFARGLWWIYGHTYDGLLHFWPYQNLTSRVIDRLDVKPGQRVLDLGCGTGNMAAAILQVEKTSVYGVDISSTMLSVAKKKLKAYGDRVSFHRGDIVNFLKSQSDNSFDRIVSVNVIYALNDRSDLWQEMLRVLKPTGKIAITTSVRPGSGPIIKEHFDNAGLREVLRLKLVGVFVVDALINLLGHSGAFEFADEAKLEGEVAAAGGRWVKPEYCYGGAEKGVNVLVEVLPGKK